MEFYNFGCRKLKSIYNLYTMFQYVQWSLYVILKRCKKLVSFLLTEETGK